MNGIWIVATWFKSKHHSISIWYCHCITVVHLSGLCWSFVLLCFYGVGWICSWVWMFFDAFNVCVSVINVCLISREGMYAALFWVCSCSCVRWLNWMHLYMNHVCDWVVVQQQMSHRFQCLIKHMLDTSQRFSQWTWAI